MSKDLLYILCTITLKEKEIYQLFQEISSYTELENYISDRIKKEDIKRAKDYLKKANYEYINITSILDEDYPELLKNIDYPPPILFYKGEYKEVDKNAIAIIGSRDPSFKGIDLTEYFIKDFEGLPITIVSGLARGIDTCAHNGALKYNLRTIGVLGCGIDIIYPASNRHLYKEIVNHGCIFSEFPIGTPPLPQNFPRRNRIISGLSKAVVVIESGERSGSLITAKFAVEQCRELFVIPRTPLDKNSQGNNMLIKNGAKIAISGKDVLEDLFPHFLENKKIEQKAIKLTIDEEEILSKMGEEPINFDTLCFLLDKGPSTLANFLLQLELKGIIKALPGKSYIKVRSL